MVISALGLEFVTLLNEFIGHGLSIENDLFGIGLPGRRSDLEESSCNGSDGVVMWSTLACREHGIVDSLLEVLGRFNVLAEEDETGTRTTKSLVSKSRNISQFLSALGLEYVRGGGNNVTMFERTGQFTSSDQTGCMSHITHEPSLLIIGNLAQILVIPISWISRGTANDETWFEGLCRLFKRGIVDQLGLGFESVGEGLEVDGGCGDFLFGGVVAVS